MFTNAALGGWDQMERKTQRCKWKMKRGEDSCSDKLGGVGCCSLLTSVLAHLSQRSSLQIGADLWMLAGGRERQSKVLTGCRINIGSLLNYRTLHHSQRRCVHGAEKDTEQT